MTTVGVSATGHINRVDYGVIAQDSTWCACWLAIYLPLQRIISMLCNMSHTLSLWISRFYCPKSACLDPARAS